MSTPSGYGVDFYLPEQRRLVQVAQNLDNPSTREREFRALENGIQGVRAASALILADENEEGIEIGGVPVEIRSISEWLLDPP